MQIIAHRGARGLELENSVASIRTALGFDVDAIEFDVHLTRDHKLVVMHDSTTRRTAKTNVRICDATLAKLRQIRLKNGQQIPTLDEILQLIHDKQVFIDIKAAGCADPLVRLLQKYPRVSASFASYRPEELARIRALLPRAETYLYFLKSYNLVARPFKMVRVARGIGATGISIDKLYLLNPITYIWAKRQGLETAVYSIGTKGLARLLLSLYPALHVLTSRPDAINHRTLA